MTEPERIGKYAIVETLGSGGMATVYRALDPDLQRHVALKVLHPHLCGREESRVRFRREARAVARLRHPNVLEVYDAGEEEGRPFIVSELVDGANLEAWARGRSPIPPEVAAAVGLCIAEGLHAAHQAGIIHRDLKPGNILLGAGGKVKIADFGIAQVLDIEHVTSTGQILGSPAFMSPEHLEGRRLDARADVFSFGTLLYWLVVGELPFTGPNAHVVLRKVLEGRHPDPARARPEIGEQLAEVIRTCLQRKPEDRYAGMADVASALRAFLSVAGSTDAAGVLASFEADPAAAREAIRAHRDRAILDRCRALRGSRHAAAEIRNLCGWILAYDPQNAEALRLVEETLHGGAARLRLIVAGAIGAAFIAVALLVWMRDASTGGEVPAASVRHAAPASRAGGPSLAAAGREGPLLPPALRDASSAGTIEDGGIVDAPSFALATITDEVAVEAARDEIDAGETDERSIPDARHDAPPDAARAPPAPLARRIVVFRPVPQNVEIAVDGSRIGKYGPEGLGFVTRAELTVGRHEFSFVSLTNCCYPATWSQVVPEGDEPLIVGKRLQGRPARLFVDTGGVPATVDVLGRATGRANAEISIPFYPTDDLELRLRISVTFPGARPSVLPERTVRAGESITISGVAPPSDAGIAPTSTDAGD